jgi:fibro-slime domain-containing protein
MKSFFIGIATSVSILSCAAATVLVVACGSSGEESGFRQGASIPDASRADGSGGPSLGDGVFEPFGDGGGGQVTSQDASCGPRLVGTLRDFHDTHPDFEKFVGDDRGVVSRDLGADFKPVYLPVGSSATTTGAANFDQWYRDVPDVNMSLAYELMLTPGANGISTFDSAAFFPLDGKGFGNEGRDHNFHFTFELHTEFLYKGGEIFKFTGDDDVWVYVNGKLAIDLGGIHNAQTMSLDLDAQAASLGLVREKTIELAIFQAERHVVESHFRVDTTITFTNCAPIIR